MNGFINLYKPSGMTSFRAVAIVRRLTGEKSCGHCGTLDPNAVGILPVAVGKATKLSDVFLGFSKTYVAEMEFGKFSDTGDIWGNVGETELKYADKAVFESVLPEFTGDITQLPPAYSALKVGGTPAYKLARKGQEVNLAPRIARIYSIELIDYAWPRAIIRVSCGRGTYIRTLCEDIAKRLGNTAVMTQLERVSYGDMTKEMSVTLEELENKGISEGDLIPMDSVLKDMEKVLLDAKQSDDYRHGRTVLWDGSGKRRVYDSEGRLIGIAEIKNGSLRSDKNLE